MIRSSNGVRLLSSHLNRDACSRSIYEGVFHRKLDSGICTISSVIGVGGHGTVNPNHRLLSNTSIRGSVSLSRPDYERSNHPGYIKRPPVKGVTEKDFRKGFKNWCKRYGRIFNSEGEEQYMFKWFCDNHRYGREFYHGLKTGAGNDWKISYGFIVGIIIVSVIVLEILAYLKRLEKRSLPPNFPMDPLAD